jgi:hypothetical protein
MNRTALAIPLLAAAAALALSGCGETAIHDPAGNPATAVGDGKNDNQDSYHGRYRVTAAVLQNKDHGPQLCDAVAESYPPQCEGPDIVGWDWDAVKADSAQGVTWGTYTLFGTWDGKRFTVKEPEPKPAAPGDQDPADAPDFRTPCPKPADGRQAPDQDKAGAADRDAALQRASGLSGYAGAWLDGDVVNVRVTEGREAAERELRTLWGGPLCLSGAKHTEAELTRVQNELTEELPDLQSAGVDVVSNSVDVRVLVAEPELQRKLDEKYGEDAVTVSGWLQPIDLD